MAKGKFLEMLQTIKKSNKKVQIFTPDKHYFVMREENDVKKCEFNGKIRKAWKNLNKHF